MPFPPSTKRTILAYQNGCDTYLKAWHQPIYRMPPHLEFLVTRLRRRALVLDLGCGPGQDSRHLRRLRFKVVGLDLTKPFLLAARKKSPTLPLVQADILKLPLQPNTFEGIWAAASLIHLPKSKLTPVLRQLHTLSRPGGILGATLIHGKGSGFLPDEWIPDRYVSKWVKPDLQKVLQQTGWEILSLQTVSHRERKGRWLNVIARRGT